MKILTRFVKGPKEISNFLDAGEDEKYFVKGTVEAVLRDRSRGDSYHDHIGKIRLKPEQNSFPDEPRLFPPTRGYAKIEGRSGVDPVTIDLTVADVIVGDEVAVLLHEEHYDGGSNNVIKALANLTTERVYTMTVY